MSDGKMALEYLGKWLAHYILWLIAMWLDQGLECANCIILHWLFKMLYISLFIDLQICEFSPAFCW